MNALKRILALLTLVAGGIFGAWLITGLLFGFASVS